MSKELLFSVTADDCDFQCFSAGGKGGQHQNRTASAVRCIHRESRAEGISRDSRSQWQNKKLAFKRMTETKTFQNWLKLETGRRMLSSEEKRRQEQLLNVYLDDALKDENLRVEMKDENGKWIPYAESSENSEKKVDSLE